MIQSFHKRTDIDMQNYFLLNMKFLCTIRYLEFGQILLKSLVSKSVNSNYTMLIAKVHKLQAFNEL